MSGEAEDHQPQEDECGWCSCVCAIWGFISPIIEFFVPITLTYLLLWLILRPSHVRPRVDAAVLVQFHLSNATSTLDYGITVDLSFHNRHKYLGARYLDLVAVASYGGTRLGPSINTLPVFFQHPKTSNTVHAVFHGRAAHLDPAAAEVFGREATNGSFGVLVTVSSTFMYKILFEKPVYYYKHECYIRFPLPRNGTPATAVSTPETLCTATSW